MANTFKKGDTVDYDNGTIKKTFVVYTVGEHHLYSDKWNTSSHAIKYCKISNTDNKTAEWKSDKQRFSDLNNELKLSNQKKASLINDLKELREHIQKCIHPNPRNIDLIFGANDGYEYVNTLIDDLLTKHQE